MQTEDYIHRIGRTARSTNVGTAYTLLTSDNARHLPKLIEVLRESNQQISDALYNLASRSGVRLNIGGSKFQRGGYNNNSNGNYNQNGNSRNNNYNNNHNGYGMNNGNNTNGYQRDNSNGPRKRDHASSETHNDLNGSRSGDNGTKLKKFRWDEGPAPTNNSRSSPHNANGYSNGSTPRSNNNNNNATAYGPYPVNSSNSSIPPAAQPSQPSRPVSNDYNPMYNIQYYQAIAAAAAANGGSWQTAANYPNWQASSAATATASATK